jgi:cysteine desulfurase
MHGNNEIGNLMDLQAAGEICREHGAYFHSDTVQTVGHFPLNVSDIYVQFITGSAHKFHGPKGSGFLYINGEIKIKPFIEGGAQERNMRAGTENVAGVIGLAAALNIACEEMEEHADYIRGLKNYMKERIANEFPDAIINGETGESSLYTVLNVAFPPGKKTEMLMFNLDFDGIAVSGGSACSSGSTVGSHVIRELKLPEGYKPIRFSFSKFNTKEEIDFVLERLKEHVSPEESLVK